MNMTNVQISTIVTVGLVVAFSGIFAFLVWHSHNVRRKQAQHRN